VWCSLEVSSASRSRSRSRAIRPDLEVATHAALAGRVPYRSVDCLRLMVVEEVYDGAGDGEEDGGRW
jgi:hypothetical protein